MIGRVYKIVCMVDDDIVYIGSTINTLRQRWINHINHYKTKHCYTCIYEYFDIYGIEYFEIVLIKEYDVVDEKHLQAREQLWISSTKCVNINNSFSLYCILKNQYKKRHHINNKDIINERSKQFYINNKVKLSSKITCECGSIVRYSDISTHRRTAKHLRLIAEH